MSLKIVFFGTPSFSIPVLDGIRRSQHGISLVLTQPDKLSGRGMQRTFSHVKTYSKVKKLSCLQFENLSKKDISSIDPDIIIIVAYGMLLPKEIMNLPKYGCINLHPSLLSSYRGPAPIQHSIISGEKEVGNSIIRLDKGMDTGPFLIKNRCIIFPWEHSKSIHNRMSNTGAALIDKVLKWISLGKIISKKQNKHSTKYSHKIEKFFQLINWIKTEQKILSEYKALHCWPMLKTRFKNKEIKVLQCNSSRVPSDIEPGTLVNFSRNGVFVSTSHNILIAKKIQFPNSRILKCNFIVNIEKSGLHKGAKFYY